MAAAAAGVGRLSGELAAVGGTLDGVRSRVAAAAEAAGAHERAEARRFEAVSAAAEGAARGVGELRAGVDQALAAGVLLLILASLSLSQLNFST